MKIQKITDETINMAKKYAEHTFANEIYYRADYPTAFYDAVEKWYRDNKSLPYGFRLCVLASLIARSAIYTWSFQLPSNNEVRFWLPIVYKATKNKLPLKAIEADNDYDAWYRVIFLFDGRYKWCRAPKNPDSNEYQENYNIPVDAYGIYEKCEKMHREWCVLHRYEGCAIEKHCSECFSISGKEVEY